MKQRRNLFEELMEVVDAMQQQREGKKTLRSLWPEVLLVAITGVYGVIATMVVPAVTGRRRVDDRPAPDNSRDVAETRAARTAAS